MMRDESPIETKVGGPEDLLKTVMEQFSTPLGDGLQGLPSQCTPMQMGTPFSAGNDDPLSKEIF